MTFKEIINKVGEKKRARKELLNSMDDHMRVQEILENRKKSANERELEKLIEEKRQKIIKARLDIERKERDDEINFGHNPLNTKNIMKAQWEVMKERNQFANNKNMFSNQQFIHKNNPNLLKNNRRLCGI